LAAQNRTWRFTADRIVAQHDSEYVQAWGNATLRYEDNYLSADFVRYYEATSWVFLKGNVRAMWNGDFYQASEAEFDLQNMAGWLKQGRVFVAKPHVYLESELIRKYQGDAYSFRDARITACPGDTPAWSVRASQGYVTLDGYAMLWDTDFLVRNQTVMYSPYLQLPIMRERQSGLLFPEVGRSSRNGFFINQPIYWAVDEENDLTFFENYMVKRGFMQGVEWRNTPDTHTKGLWRFDYLHDQKVAGSEADEDDQFQGDGLIRPNHDRYWLRSKFDGYLGDPEWKVKVDLDYVSDQDYLREFESGYSGYESSEDHFLEEFGRTIDPFDAQNRTSTAVLTRSWDHVGLAAKLEYTESTNYMNRNLPSSENPTVQRLPEIDVFAFKDAVPGAAPLEWRMDSQFAYFWREYGTQAGRLDLNPSLSLPLQGGGFTLIPRAGVHETIYAITKRENDPGVTQDALPARTVPELGASAFTELYRVFSLGESIAPSKETAGESYWTALKHSIQPRLDYTYIPRNDYQRRLPEFDRDDRIHRRNSITYSLTNVLDRKRQTVSLDPGTGKASLAPDYLDFFRLRLEQSYDLFEASRTEDLAQYQRRPFSDILAEVTLKPVRYLSLNSRTYFSPYIGDVTEHDHMLTLTYPDWGEAYFGLSFKEPVDEFTRKQSQRMRIIRVGGKVFLASRFTASFDYSFDAVQQRDIEKRVRLAWNHECFTLRLIYSMTHYDSRYEVQLDLFSFGE
ncbi:MAG: LPS-assembly protein LptD, partial [Desulfovibrionaceae bacterium]